MAHTYTLQVNISGQSRNLELGVALKIYGSIRYCNSMNAAKWVCFFCTHELAIAARSNPARTCTRTYMYTYVHTHASTDGGTSACGGLKGSCWCVAIKWDTYIRDYNKSNTIALCVLVLWMNSHGSINCSFSGGYTL